MHGCHLACWNLCSACSDLPVLPVWSISTGAPPPCNLTSPAHPVPSPLQWLFARQQASCRPPTRSRCSWPFAARPVSFRWRRPPLGAARLSRSSRRAACGCTPAAAASQCPRCGSRLAANDRLCSAGSELGGDHISGCPLAYGDMHTRWVRPSAQRLPTCSRAALPAGQSL